MRRLITSTSRAVAALLVGVLLTICSLGVLSAHSSSNPTQQKASCSSSCHSHGQTTGINNQENKDEEEDKEPIPPLFGWLQIPVDLALLYVMPVFGVLWFVSSKQKILLTTQLRF